MTDIQIFNNPEFGTIRTLDTGEQVLFCASDAAKALGYTNPRDAIAKHCWRVMKRDVPHPQSPSKTLEMSFIPESDLYRLIFSSKLPTAEKFTDWVATEVLPSIRRNGHYMTPAALREAILNPDTVIQLCQQIKAEQEKNARLTAENERLTATVQTMQPKAEFFDRQVAANQLTGLYQTADALRIPRQTFVRWLVEKKYLARNPCGKLVPIDTSNDGLFQLREYGKTGKRITCTQTMVTPKGRETFRLLLVGPHPGRKEG